MIIDGMIQPVQKSFELVKYKRSKVTKCGSYDSYFLVEHVLEKLDEDYGDPEDGYSETIDTKKWVEENAPSWIEGGLTFEPDKDE